MTHDNIRHDDTCPEIEAALAEMARRDLDAFDPALVDRICLRTQGLLAGGADQSAERPMIVGRIHRATRWLALAAVVVLTLTVGILVSNATRSRTTLPTGADRPVEVLAASLERDIDGVLSMDGLWSSGLGDRIDVLYAETALIDDGVGVEWLDEQVLGTGGSL
ncbi:MAG: hypothetical protein H6811_11885 [Phycisphaeraceae bacterium]|nr:hypothetical protein [Phycisphaeraceae bacterium]